MMTRFPDRLGKGVRALLATGVVSTTVCASAMAQVVDPNPGALTFTGGLDVPSVHVFRGIVQERDPKLTLWPYGDIGLALYAGDGGLKRVGVTFGVWNSLQTGSSGLDGPSRRLHYWEDFYAALSLGLGGGLNVQGGFAVHTSPNAMFTTIKEVSVKASKADRLAPYGFVAFEIDDNGQADGGLKKGTYLELGAGPHWALRTGGPALTVPVKIGVSLKDYYEGAAGDDTFGFFQVGAVVTIPFTGVPSRFGSWNVHGGGDVLVFGDTTEALNVNRRGETSRSKVVGLLGIGVTY